MHEGNESKFIVTLLTLLTLLPDNSIQFQGPLKSEWYFFLVNFF